jgi:hypothetical protein
MNVRLDHVDISYVVHRVQREDLPCAIDLGRRCARARHAAATVRLASSGACALRPREGVSGAAGACDDKGCIRLRRSDMNVPSRKPTLEHRRGLHGRMIVSHLRQI